MLTREFATDLFRTIDRKDTEGFAALFAEDGAFRFANAPAVPGRSAVREAVGGFFQSIRALAHELRDVWIVDTTLLCRGQVTYTRHDGSTLSVPFADIITLRGDEVVEYEIYLDASQLYQPAA